MKRLKGYAMAALSVALGCFLYANYSSDEGSGTYLSSQQTALWDRLLPVRLALRVVAGVLGGLAFVQLIRGNPTGLWAWLAAILCSTLLLFVPTYPNETPLPFATAVAAGGILFQMALWTLAIRSLLPRPKSTA